MLAWFSWLAQTVFALGYPGVCLALLIEGLGLPFPGEAVMAFYGFAAAEGRFQVLGVLMASTLGYVLGAAICYGICRLYGPRLNAWVQRWTHTSWIAGNAASMRRATRMIDKYGPILLIPGRFLPGIRTVSSYIAGLSGMDVKLFFLCTVTGTVLWSGLWIGLGYWLGENVKELIQSLQSSLGVISVILVMTGTAIWWWRRRAAAR